jgi:hypothetical protein
MRRLILLLILGTLFAFPSFASAQTNVTLSNVTVQLWPEYDQPSMLVIIDFQVAPGTPLPVDLNFRIPLDSNLIAVASLTNDGGFLNAAFDGPQEDGEWLTFTMTVNQNTIHRFEYYQPLTLNENQRIFSYLWDGMYAVDSFHISVLKPLDAVSLVTDPAYQSTEDVNGLTYYDSEVLPLARGEQFALNLQYEKTTDTLVRPPQGIQPVAPVDQNTPGRVSLTNSMPYIIGGFGVVLILGGIMYYFQAGRAPSKRTRSRKRSQAESEDDGAEAYCPQCGSRAKRGDRFCRTCGARLRNQEE